MSSPRLIRLRPGSDFNTSGGLFSACFGGVGGPSGPPLLNQRFGSLFDPDRLAVHRLSGTMPLDYNYIQVEGMGVCSARNRSNTDRIPGMSPFGGVVGKHSIPLGPFAHQGINRCDRITATNPQPHNLEPRDPITRLIDTPRKTLGSPHTTTSTTQPKVTHQVTVAGIKRT